MWPSEFMVELGHDKYLLVPCVIHFVGISGEFGRTMVPIFVRRSRTEISMASPNEPDMSPKRAKETRFVIYHTQSLPSDRIVVI